MVFKCFSLLIDGHVPSLEDFQAIGGISKYRLFSSNNYLYEFSLEIVENRFVMIAVDYDDQRYRSTVYDMESEEEVDNPKKRTQIELKQQFFSCYDTDNKELFISDPQKRGALKQFLQEKSNNVPVRISARISSASDFEQYVKYISKVKYIQTRNLVNCHPDSIFAQRYDPLGLDMPDKLTTTLEYETKLSVANLGRRIKELFDKNKTKEIESIEIYGEDENGFEQHFSFDKIIKEITIEIIADEDKRYDKDSVFDLLLLKLKGMAG